MNIDISKYEITDGKTFDMSAHSSIPDFSISKKESKKIIKKNVKEIADFQERMFANQNRSALVVFQAMDAAGKDGTIERLATGVNPQGIYVSAFKAPTPLELRHNFLWRVNLALPPRGVIGIFNRSHYEEVLVVRVHPSYLIPQDIPGIKKVEDVTNSLWERRYRMIRNFEQNLIDTGMLVVKIFLNISKEEQKKRLLDRIADPDKHWKFNLGDVKERLHWKEYMEAFEEAIKNTATDDAPWYVVPGDDKQAARAIVTTIVEKQFAKHKESWPDAGANKRDEIDAGEEMLESE